MNDDVSRFWSKVEITEGCWIWVGGIRSDGYGRFNFNNYPGVAHRYSYMINIGPIPENLVLDHLCRQRNCVNPDHLEIVTNGENVRRGEGVCSVNRRKTHCKRGHQFNEEHTVHVLKNGKPGRMCRTCMIMLKRGYTKQKQLSRLHAELLPRQND